MIQESLFPMPQQGNTSDDYWTPKWIFDALGIEFDLDVACPPGGASHTPCKAFYTQETDGLASPWLGNVWMNPPYSKPTPWVDRFLSHGNGIALLPFTTGKWWFNMWNHADVVMPISHRHKFDRADGTTRTITFNTALYGIGEVAVQAIQRFKLHRIR